MSLPLSVVITLALKSLSDNYNVCIIYDGLVTDSFVAPWTVAHRAPLSVGAPRQGYWSGLPFSPPGHLPDPGIEPVSLTSPALAGRFFTI